MLSPTTTPSVQDKIIEAVNHYYTNTSSTGSLYSSDGLSDVFSSSSPDTYPEDLIFPIAAQESGGVDFNNEVVTFDYGQGIMQLTNRPSSSDIMYLHMLLYNDPYTALATTEPYPFRQICLSVAIMTNLPDRCSIPA